MELQEPSFIKDVNKVLDKNPDLLDDLIQGEEPEVKGEEEFFESIFKEGKYFDLDSKAIEDTKGDIDNDFEYVIETYYKKDFITVNPNPAQGATVQSAPLTLDGKSVGDSDSAIEYANNMLNEAFGNDKEEFKLKTKALFLIYTSGLSVQSSNLFGVYSCLVSAIRRVGEECGVLANNLARKLRMDAEDNNISIEAVGQISNCSFDGKKFTIDPNDKFANASDGKYVSRIDANIRDDNKVNNKSHQLKSKMMNKFYNEAFNTLFEDESANDKLNDIIAANLKKGASGKTEKELREKFEKKCKRQALKDSKDLYEQWLASGDIDKVMARYEKDIEAEKSANNDTIDFF